jgi:hypothetical protein
VVTWNKRPFEIASLFNPAFCSLLLYDVIRGYEKSNPDGIPYAIPFVIFPLVLHKPTRDVLPKRTNALLFPWIQNNPQVRIGFAKRARNFSPYLKEAIMFGIQTGVFQITEKGNLQTLNRFPKIEGYAKNTELDELRKNAKLLGNWFTSVKDTSTLFVLLGVRP